MKQAAAMVTLTDGPNLYDDLYTARLAYALGKPVAVHWDLEEPPRIRDLLPLGREAEWPQSDRRPLRSLGLGHRSPFASYVQYHNGGDDYWNVEYTLADFAQLVHAWLRWSSVRPLSAANAA
jgi:hypothetical protein